MHERQKKSNDWRRKDENQKYKLEKVAIIAMYCHLRPPDAITFEASNLRCR